MSDSNLEDLEALEHFLVVARHQGRWLAGVLPKEEALRFTGQETDRSFQLNLNQTNPNLSACRPDQPNKGRDRKNE